MIEVNSVTKKYDNFVSLDNVSFKVKDGSIFGLIGSNGSGKSTLLRIMCGVFAPNIGEVLYDGVPVYENESVKRGIVYLSDESFFKPHSTINDIRSLYKSIWPAFSDDKFYKLRDAFGLDINTKIGKFSKGMQKQAAVLLSLSACPKYLLCDETFDGLDPVMRKLVKTIIADEVAAGNITPIIASHNLSELEDFCDHIALLHKSDLVIEADLDDIKLGIHRLQAVFEDEITPEDFPELEISAFERRGRLTSFIVRGSDDMIMRIIGEKSPVYSELLPLSLDEIFISEMEGKGYDFTKLDIGR
ncbi:MAG: ABC transporter ATP-binding protein [Ruminococcaceae bacterium]|nr:ABC transporter ATP-binding protein [Oscillospiraceae bacterium]